MVPNLAVGQGNPRGWTRYFADAVLGAAFALMLVGCLPIPVSKSKTLPDISPHLSAEDTGGARPILVFTQSLKGKTGGVFLWNMAGTLPSVVEARFVKGNDLAAFHDDVKLYSEEGVGLVVVAGVGPGLGGSATWIRRFKGKTRNGVSGNGKWACCDAHPKQRVRCQAEGFNRRPPGAVTR